MIGQPPPPPRAPAVERVRAAYYQRHVTDYEFTQRGWDIFFIVLCGIYGWYVFFQLMKREQHHQRRTCELLDAANEFAWEQAVAKGATEQQRPNFERISGHLAHMREQTSAFRSPGLWVLFAVLGFVGVTIVGFVVQEFGPIGYVTLFINGGLVEWIGFAVIDADYVRHDADEGAVQAELSTIFSALGEYVPPPDQYRMKGNHNYVGRFVAGSFSLGIYQFWWYADLMREGNWHMYHCWTWEDGLAQAVYRLSSSPPPALAPGAAG